MRNGWKLVVPTLAMAMSGALAAEQADLRPAELAQAYVVAYNAHDVPKLMALFADDVIVSTPDLTVVKGRAANQKYYQAWFQSVPDVKNTIKSLVYDDETRFVLELVETGTYKKAMPSPGSPPATGQKLRYPYVIVATVKNGRLNSVRIYENDLVIEKQLGIRK